MVDAWKLISPQSPELAESINKQLALEFIKNQSPEEIADIVLAFMFFIEMAGMGHLMFEIHKGDTEWFHIVARTEEDQAFFMQIIDGPRLKMIELSDKTRQEYTDAMRRN